MAQFGSPHQYEEMLRDELLVERLQAAFEASVNVPESEIHETWAKYADRVELSYVLFPTADARTEVKVTDAEVQAFAAREGARIEKFYQDNAARFDQPRKVRARHILARVEGNDDAAAKKKIEGVIARLDKGENFAKLAAELSDDDNTKANGGDLGIHLRGPRRRRLRQGGPGARPGEALRARPDPGRLARHPGRRGRPRQEGLAPGRPDRDRPRAPRRRPRGGAGRAKGGGRAPGGALRQVALRALPRAAGGAAGRQRAARDGGAEGRPHPRRKAGRGPRSRALPGLRHHGARAHRRRRPPQGRAGRQVRRGPAARLRHGLRAGGGGGQGPQAPRRDRLPQGARERTSRSWHERKSQQLGRSG